MINLYDKDFWLTIFHIFTVSLLVYSIIHRIWEHSRTTLIVIVGFEILGLLMQFCSIAYTILFLMILMMFLYYRAMTKPIQYWSKNERHSHV